VSQSYNFFAIMLPVTSKNKPKNLNYKYICGNDATSKIFPNSPENMNTKI